MFHPYLLDSLLLALVLKLRDLGGVMPPNPHVVIIRMQNDLPQSAVQKGRKQNKLWLGWESFLFENLFGERVLFLQVKFSPHGMNKCELHWPAITGYISHYVSTWAIAFNLNLPRFLREKKSPIISPGPLDRTCGPPW